MAILLNPKYVKTKTDKINIVKDRLINSDTAEIDVKIFINYPHPQQP